VSAARKRRANGLVGDLELARAGGSRSHTSHHLPPLKTNGQRQKADRIRAAKCYACCGKD